MRKDELQVSKPILKYMMYSNSYEDGRYTCYEFIDEGGNVGLHYQIRPELLEDKKQIGQARLWQTKISKLKKGDIAIVMCRCREIQEEGYNQSVMYLNIDRILKPLTKVKLVTKDYRGIPTEFAEETIIRSWDEVK
ncbi:MAG: hypothetical protein U0L18_09040 [Acutalibacteraceae bacterium]|nr:hypothetical protein [Acutalibacteraceae bacterium]